MTKISRAAQRELDAAALLEQAAELIFLASASFRADTTGTIMSGKLVAARLIVNDVSEQIKGRAV